MFTTQITEYFDAATAAHRHSERALAMMLTHRGDAGAEIELALACDPHSMAAHCLRAALIVSADDASARDDLDVSIAVIEAIADEGSPARRHAQAAQAWRDDNEALAADLYGAIATDRPFDIVAIAAAHALDFHLGRRDILCRRMAMLVSKWTPNRSGYASVLAMYAFALEEAGEYHRAEAWARRALAADPQHLGAIHAVVHVMEMQGRAQEGLAFLAANEAAWRVGGGYAVHLAWHQALLHLDVGSPHTALDIYDTEIATAADSMSVLADASALLWRLDLLEIDVNSRWRALAARWEQHALEGASPFFVVHALMALASAGHAGGTERALRALPALAQDDASAPPAERLAAPLTNALIAFAEEDYAACIEWLVRVRHIADRCGGSVAQCDLIHLTFTEAALRARKIALARELVSERAALKPGSRLNRLLQQRLKLLPSLKGVVAA